MNTTPTRRLRILLIDDEERAGRPLLEELNVLLCAAKPYQPLSITTTEGDTANFEKPLWVSNLTRAQEHLFALRRQGKQLHLVVMDFKLAEPDTQEDARDFLTAYIGANPRGYWCWCTAFPDDAAPSTIRTHIGLEARKLTTYHKGTNQFTRIIPELISRITSDFLSQPKRSTLSAILTDRSTLSIVDGFIIRRDDPNGPISDFDDDLVPGFPLFENSLIIHVPELPLNAVDFAEGIIRRQRVGHGYATAKEKVAIHKAWVGRKGYKSLQLENSPTFSTNFSSVNPLRFASQFNFNLLWLSAASPKGWRGSFLLGEDANALKPGATRARRVVAGFNEDIEVVREHREAALWRKNEKGYRKDPGILLRPWGPVYKQLDSMCFLQEVVGDPGTLTPGTEASPLRASDGTIETTIDPDAKLYIDRGTTLFDVRNKIEIEAQAWSPTP